MSSEQPPAGAADDVPKWVKTMTMVPMLVGLVANAWAKLEHTFVPLTRRLLRTPDNQIAKAVLFSCNPVQRRDLINALTHISDLPPLTKDRIRSLMNEFDSVRVLRNSIVHGVWAGLTRDGDYMLRVTSSREKLKETLEPREAEWVMSVANRIDNLSIPVIELSQEVENYSDAAP